MCGKTSSTTSDRVTGSGLRELLDERGIKYSWAASRMGIWPSRMTGVLQGTRTVSRDQAEALCAELGVPFFAAFRSADEDHFAS